MAHRTRSTAVLLTVLALGASAAAVRAQVPPPEAQAEPAAVATELQHLNATLVRIAELLERRLEGQRLDLRLKRLEAASRRVDALEGDLGRARSSRSSLADQRFQMQSRLENLAAEVEQADPETLPNYERMLREAERIMERFETRIAELDARILEIENELGRRRADLQALEDRLDRELDGLE